MIKIKSGKIVFSENNFDIQTKDSAVIICVLNGEGYFENEIINRGTCIVVPRDCSVEIDTSNAVEIARFEIENFDKAMPLVVYTENCDSVELLAKLIEKSPKKDGGFFEGVSVIFNSLVDVKSDEASVGNKYVDMAKRYIDANYGKQIKIEDIAAHVGTDRKYLRNLFFKYLGVSTKDYLTNLRIEKAKELLCGNTMAVNEISASVGYPDALAFSKIFKKQTGLSPSEYRGGTVSAKNKKQEEKEDIKYFLL